MDLSQITAAIQQDEEGVVVPLTDRGGEPQFAADGSPVSITIVGMESARYRRAHDAQTRRMMRTRRTKLEPEDIRQNRVALAAAAIIAWHGIERDGQPVPCTPENVDLLLRPSWMLAQVESAIEAHADFFAKGSAS